MEYKAKVGIGAEGYQIEGHGRIFWTKSDALSAARSIARKEQRRVEITDMFYKGMYVDEVYPKKTRGNPRGSVKLPRTGHTGFLTAKAVDVITREGRVVEVKVKR